MLKKILFIFALCSANPLFAEIIGTIQQPEGTIALSSPSALIVMIIKYAIGLTGILGVMGATWGGIGMILSVGEDEKQKKSRFIIIYSIVGVILSGLAYSIVSIISSVTI